MPSLPHLARFCALPIALVLLPLKVEAQSARPAAATTTLSIPWGDTPLVLRISGATRWTWVEDRYFTPVGADSGKLMITPNVALQEEEDPIPTCAATLENPADGQRPVPNHPAVPTGGAWHATALDIGEMAIGCVSLKSGYVLFEIRASSPGLYPRARPLVAAFAAAAASRWNAAPSAPE